MVLGKNVPKDTVIRNTVEPYKRKAGDTASRRAVQPDSSKAVGTTKFTIRLPVELVWSLKQRALNESKMRGNRTTSTEIVERVLRAYLRK